MHDALPKRGPVRVFTLSLSLVTGTLLAGCGGSDKRLSDAMGVRNCVCPDYRSSIAVLDEYRTAPRNKSDYAVFGMSATAVGVCGGDYHDADRIGKETYIAVKKYQDASAETLAAWGNEAIKFFKGEPHERSMLAYYLGLTAYVRGEFNDARIFFMQSLLSAATRDEDASAFREDFRLGHYWLGRAYLRLGDRDNARVAFGKAAVTLEHKGQAKEREKLRRDREKQYPRELKLEATCYRKATTAKQPVAGAVDLSAPQTRDELPATLPDASPDNPVRSVATDLVSFLTPSFQESVNLVVVVELGGGPYKYLAGSQGQWDEVAPMPYKERIVDLYLDGHRAGSPFPLCEMYHQAVTRGVETRRGRQTGKMIAKEVLRRAPFVGGLFGLWDVSGDARYIPTLPGEVHVFAARVEPGLHTITMYCCDINGNVLPRYTIERHFIPVPETGEQVLVLQTKENQDNDYLLEQSLQFVAHSQ